MKTLGACFVSWLVLSLWMTVELRFTWGVLLSAALTVGVLYVAASLSRVRGWPLFWPLAALYGGIGVVNIFLEGVAFGMFTSSEAVYGTLIGMTRVALVSGILAFGLSRGAVLEEPAEGPGLARWLWLRVSGVGLAYAILFFVAGALIFPYVKEFYQTSGLFTFPSEGAMFAIEWGRGLVYAGALALLFRRMAGRRWQAAIVGGLALAVLGGAAPLALPVDDVLPWDVRRYHLIEILWSNFALGVIAAFLMVRRGAQDQGRTGLPENRATASLAGASHH